MKTTILTFISAVILTAGTANFSKAAVKTNEETVLASIGNINQIEVHGNVEVHLANGAKDAVTVNNNYYAENALLQNENGVLHIASYKTEKLVVYVTVNDLRAITVYDNAVVKTEGVFSAIALDVNLYNNAYAGLNLDNYAANVTVNDQAKTDLSGNVDEYELTYSSASTVNRSALVAVNATENKIMAKAPVVKHKRHQAEEVTNLSK